MMDKDAPILLIDTPGLIFRAFYSIRELTSPDGIPTNALYGVLLQVLKVLKDVEPKASVAFFDTAAPTFREQVFQDYKAQRPLPPDELVAQFPLVIQALESAKFPIVLEPGYEADDLIASYATLLENEPKLILTGDRDMLQLLNGNTQVMMQTKGVTEVKLYTVETFKKEYGFSPSYFVDFKALRGDPSDNIPGVPGVGEKTATKLISQYESLEKLYEHLEEIKPERIRQAIQEKKEEVFGYRELVRLRRDIDLAKELPELKLPDFGRDEFLEFCDRFALKAIKKQVLSRT